MGKGAREVDPAVGRHVSVEEALSHVRQCIEDGLIPFVGRFKADNLLWGVKDRGKLLTVCFCCSCCCMIMNTIRYMPQISHERIVKLKGLKIIVDNEQCKMCGACTKSCFMGALSMSDGKIIRDNSLCKGCGLCITACPNKAVSAAVDDLQAAVTELKGRIEALIDYR
jgi:UDP-glucose 4-epimerase